MDQATGAAHPGSAHGPAAGAPCRNCGAALQGEWCHDCGQSSRDLHRSLRHLAREAAEHAFDADGRIWRTLPRLVFRPAALTRDYIAGRRASQTPPLRMFVVALLLVFLAGEWASATGHIRMMQIEGAQNDWIQTLDVHVWPAWDAAINGWLKAHLAAALSHPDLLREAMARHAHDFAFLTLPVAAASLSLMFAFRPGCVVFDHVIFSLHSLAFLGLLLVTAMLAQGAFGDACLLLLLAAPVHLYAHLKGAYRLGAAGALIRLALLSAVGVVAFGLIFAGLLATGLASLQT